MEKKKTIKVVQIVPLFLAMFCVLLFNSVLIIKDAKSGEAMSYTNDAVIMPWQLNNSHHIPVSVPVNKGNIPVKAMQNELASAEKVKVEIINFNSQPPASETISPLMEHIVPANFDEVDGNLSKEQKENVKSTVEATKKVASTLQWKEIEASIGDAMDKKEKAMAKQEYLHELDKVSWTNIEQNLKANYDKLNWEAINENVNKAMTQVQLDSIQTVYEQALSELEKTEKNLQEKVKCSSNPMPDASIEEIKLAKLTLQKTLDSLKAAPAPKKVIRL